MRTLLFYIIIAVVSFTTMFYLGDRVIAPFTSEGALNILNISIMLIFVDLTIIGTFAFLHYIADILIRKKNAKEFLGLRRAILITLLADFLILLQIYKLSNTVNIVLSVAIIIVLEILFSVKPSANDKEEDVL